MKNLNAGQRLWEAQKQQGTGLCIGLDPHFNPQAGFDEDLYLYYASQDTTLWFSNFFHLLAEFPGHNGRLGGHRGPVFLSGVTNYCLRVVEAGWKNGICIFKPQSAFYEQFGPVAFIIMARVRQEIARHHSPAFVIDDAKRGDIDTTQAAYLQSILTDTVMEMVPGVYGQLDFDAMTVTTWMGQDVLTPALPYLRVGKGVIVVTRTSNPSGTTLQDALVYPNPNVPLSDKQEPFRFTHETWKATESIIGRDPTACEVMMYLTEKFCRDNDLIQGGASPVFSVIGATVEMDEGFRKLRPTGIALIPGFGAQLGEFEDIIKLAILEGPLAGHLGILNSARASMFAWHTKFGGGGDPSPEKLEGEVSRYINQFRADEKAAYAAAGVGYPF
ncbi:MAG: orotidine-5'-phosphate decarboxylase [Candidatus Doudnabacteria bacterium]|nr:orotidine-5'-phosphate decarboxylase [Candidatus Doudnabacteria bacterium]